MKEVTLIRAWEDERATLGMLTVKKKKHDPIFTLENPLRESHVDSRIPAGRYEIVQYSSAKYPNCFEILNVPGRTKILTHWGNKEINTDGCILLGLGAGDMTGDPAVTKSKLACAEFFRLMEMQNGWITIYDVVK